MLEELIKAIHEARVEEAEKIIDLMSPVDLMKDYSNSDRASMPLHSAISRNYIHIVQLLLDKNPALANVIGKDGHNSIYYACDYIALEKDALEMFNILTPQMSKEAITFIGNSNRCFLNCLIAHRYNKIIGSLSPELLISILNKYEHGIGAIVEGLFKACDVFNVNISLHPDIADNYFYKANILYAIGKKDKAMKCYNKAIEISPDYISKIVVNIQELLTGSNSKDKPLMDFLEYLSNFKSIDPFDGSKESLTLSSVVQGAQTEVSDNAQIDDSPPSYQLSLVGLSGAHSVDDLADPFP